MSKVQAQDLMPDDWDDLDNWDDLKAEPVNASIALHRRLGLSADQIEIFAHEYTVTLDPLKAADAINLPRGKQVADRVMKFPEVAERIQQLMDERVARIDTNADYVLGSLRELADMCMGRIPQPKTRRIKETKMVDGVPETSETVETVYDIKVDASGANKALENLGRHMRLFIDQKENILRPHDEWTQIMDAMEEAGELEVEGETEFDDSAVT